MRIAQIAPLCEAVPPVLYGGTERTVAHLADALVDLGHDVTLFASAEAQTKAELVAMRDQAIRLDPSPLKSDLVSHLTLLHEVRRLEDTFDVLHFHTDMLHFPFFEHRAARTLTTVHGRLDLKDLTNVYRCWHSYPLVSISDHQRVPLRSANWVATIHHGLPIDLYQPSAVAPDGYLAFLGRISPEKRPDRAIAIARHADLPLRIAAKVDPVDRAYFNETIEPLIDQPGIDFIGEIGDAQKSAFLGNARALLFPIDWPEPFGLVLIEAMARGTPVIAWKEGAVAEIIDHGVTGFIVESEEEAVGAVQRLGTLDRRHIRHVFERRFSSHTMAGKYLALYSRLAGPGDMDLDRPLMQTAGE